MAYQYRVIEVAGGHEAQMEWPPESGDWETLNAEGYRTYGKRFPQSKKAAEGAVAMAQRIHAGRVA